MRKEVLVFGLSTNRGGIETYLLKIWQHIDHARYHFSFIDMTGEGNKPCFYDELSADGCDFYKITPRKESIIENRRDIRNLFKRHRFDILHFNVNTLSYIYPIKVALKYNCKVIVHSRNSNTQLYSLAGILHKLNRIRISKMDIHRIAVSQAAGEWLFGTQKFDVYHNGVDVERFRYDSNNRLIIRREQECENSFVIGHVGVMLPVKNHSFMIDVFKRVIEKDPTAMLWFIGDGPLRTELENKVKNQKLDRSILFLGKRNDLPLLYSGMDVLWLPSEYEGYPNVVAEAFCAGLPCLVSSKVPQDVLVGDYSIILPLEKVEIWANSLLEMKKIKDLDRENAHERMRMKGASVEDEILRIQNLYEETLLE